MMNTKSLILFAILSPLLIVGCEEQSIKNVEYFIDHPAEIKQEARGCVENFGAGKAALKEKACAAIATLFKDRCRVYQSYDHFSAPMDCENKVLMLNLAAEVA